MNIQQLIDELQAVADRDPEAVVLTGCCVDHNNWHAVTRVHPIERESTNVVAQVTLWFDDRRDVALLP